MPPLLDDPADLSSNDRIRAVAALLAAGLLRLQPPHQEVPQLLPPAVEKTTPIRPESP